MKTYAPISRESTTQSAAGTVTQKQSENNTGSRLVDNRPGTAAQRKLQEGLNNNARIRQLKVTDSNREAGEHGEIVQRRLTIGADTYDTLEAIKTLLGPAWDDRWTRAAIGFFVERHTAEPSVDELKTFLNEHSRPEAVRQPGQSTEAWNKYKGDYDTRTKLVADLPSPVTPLDVGTAMYHMAPEDTGHKIIDSGLQPKRPEWGGPDSKQDGYLSLSPAAAGAATKGAQAHDMLFRVVLTADDIAQMTRASDNEMLSTVAFAPDRLSWKYNLGRNRNYRAAANFATDPEVVARQRILDYQKRKADEKAAAAAAKARR